MKLLALMLLGGSLLFTLSSLNHTYCAQVEGRIEAVRRNWRAGRGRIEAVRRNWGAGRGEDWSGRQAEYLHKVVEGRVAFIYGTDIG
jgi:hypothetical protein